MSLIIHKTLLTLVASPREWQCRSLSRRNSGRPSSCRTAHGCWRSRFSVTRWGRHTCLLTSEPDEYPRHTSERRHASLSSWIPTFYCIMIFEISAPGGRRWRNENGKKTRKKRRDENLKTDLNSSSSSDPSWKLCKNWNSFSWKLDRVRQGLCMDRCGEKAF